MAILRKQKTGNFTTVNNYFINDPNLKPDGKGFLLFMLSKPDDWKFNFINFQKSLGIGQKAVNLHMLEDVMGWIVVLIGAIIMNFTDIRIIDSIMSIGVALFIFVNSFKNLRKVLDLFLEKTPDDVDIEKLKNQLLKINEVDDIHQIHVWSIDGFNNYATMHIVSKSKSIKRIKTQIREELKKHNICHVILETEDEACDDRECNITLKHDNQHHHHH